MDAVWSKIEGQWRWEQRTVPGDDLLVWVEVDGYGRIVGGIDITRAQFSAITGHTDTLTVAQIRDAIGASIILPED